MVRPRQADGSRRSFSRESARRALLYVGAAARAGTTATVAIAKAPTDFAARWEPSPRMITTRPIT